ncbi:MAG: ATP-binding cassette domain-containing protein [Spirochaetaceae bacterium]|nr:ATP-binding cassette domain-containing protein [Spirochaetaceae bacterium]
MKNLIKIENASVRVNGTKIIEDINFEINKGEHIAVLGPNGAGKSTLFNVCCMEIHPLWSEKLKIIRFDKERISKDELRQKMGIVSKELLGICSSSYMARDIIAGGLLSSIGLDFHHHLSKEMWNKVDEIISKYDCTKLQTKRMRDLSTGEAQKILLARALVLEPELVLLDEAANGLDFPSRSIYRDTLNTISNEGKTIVLITHDLSQILPVINKIVFMKDGKIVESGNKEEMLTEKKLSALYGKEVYLDKRNGLYSAWC